MSLPPPPIFPRASQGADGDDVVTLIDSLLAEQRQLTAVEKFSQLHGRHEAPALAPHYRDLIPLTAPRPGEQYAFEVDLDRCSGCKGCVTACHSLNGLDEDEAWRQVGFLVGESVVPLPEGRREETRSSNPGHKLSLRTPAPSGNRVIPLQQTVTTACHHCVEPACLLGCPVLAYDKDPATGIVRHLDDQCIGCSYCIMKCPYEVPQYSSKRGIVRKCDLCHGRLAEGEAPACVQACPNEAIRIALVRPAAIRIEFRQPKSGGVGQAPRPASEPDWLPDSPAAGYTLPTTRYLSTQSNHSLLAADHSQPRLAPAHWPLVLMLALTQAGIGILSAAAGFAWFRFAAATTFPMALPPWSATGGFALFVAGLGASVFHLGQPKKAWRVWLGWRTSWLSREAIALNAYAGMATLALGLLWADHASLTAHVPAAAAAVLVRVNKLPPFLWVVPLLLFAVAAMWAQTMVYADTRRHFWRIASTAPRFFGTALILGLAVAFGIYPKPALAFALGFATALKLAGEISVLKHAHSDAAHWTQLRRTAVLQLGPLRPLLVTRMALGILGGAMLPFAVSVGELAPAWALAAVALLLPGELAERWIFFTSVAPDKMPGLPR